MGIHLSNMDVMYDTIVKYRTSLGISQRELARIAGVSQATVSRIEDLEANGQKKLLLAGRTKKSYEAIRFSLDHLEKDLEDHEESYPA